MNNNILRNLSYGVYVVSTLDKTRPTGCTANSAMQITSSPATIAVSINHDNYTNECIANTKMFSVSILSEKSDPSIIGTFGFKSGRDTNKYETFAYEIVNDMPVVKDSCGYVVCKVIDSFETSTHTIFIGEVVEGDVFDNTDPMTYAYYHKVIKGTSPKSAPTYIPEDNLTDLANDSEKDIAPKEEYKCGICGYVYDGDIPFDQLPDDYVCPICGQPKEVFYKL